MYLGAIGPSLIQIALFAAYVLLLSIFRPQDVPALPPEARTLRGWALIWRCIRGMVPSLVLIFLVLGTIFMGLATPTEAGAMGVVGGFVLAWLNRRLTWALVYQAHELDHADHRDGGLHPDRRARLQPGVPGRRRQGMDRGHADRRCRAAWSAS